MMKAFIAAVLIGLTGCGSAELKKVYVDCAMVGQAEGHSLHTCKGQLDK